MLMISSSLIKTIFLFNKALVLKQSTVKIQTTKDNYNFLKYLLFEGFIVKFEILQCLDSTCFLVYLKYDLTGRSILSKIVLISKQNRQIPYHKKYLSNDDTIMRPVIIYSGKNFVQLKKNSIYNGIVFAKLFN